MAKRWIFLRCTDHVVCHHENEKFMFNSALVYRAQSKRFVV